MFKKTKKFWSFENLNVYISSEYSTFLQNCTKMLIFTRKELHLNHPHN